MNTAEKYRTAISCNDFIACSWTYLLTVMFLILPTLINMNVFPLQLVTLFTQSHYSAWNLGLSNVIIIWITPSIMSSISEHITDYRFGFGKESECYVLCCAWVKCMCVCVSVCVCVVRRIAQKIWLGCRWSHAFLHQQEGEPAPVIFSSKIKLKKLGPIAADKI